MSEERVVLTKEELNAMNAPAQKELPRYNMVDLLKLVIEFKETHPEDEDDEEFYCTVAHMEARGALNFLAWLNSGKKFREDELEELLEGDDD